MRNALTDRLGIYLNQRVAEGFVPSIMVKNTFWHVVDANTGKVIDFHFNYKNFLIQAYKVDGTWYCKC